MFERKKKKNKKTHLSSEHSSEHLNLRSRVEVHLYPAEDLLVPSQEGKIQKWHLPIIVGTI